jgi:hypothetical protein
MKQYLARTNDDVAAKKVTMFLRGMLIAAGLCSMLPACGGDDSEPAPEGTSCGGLTGMMCPGDATYCDFPDVHMCGIADGPGVCRARPDTCTKDCPGVCGCDGKPYCNACEAHRAGVDDVTDKGCMMGR